MGVERVDYYSEEEYRQAKQAEIREERERQEIQKAMEKDMLIDYLIKENTKLLNALRKIKQMNIDFTHREDINEMIDKVVNKAKNK